MTASAPREAENHDFLDSVFNDVSQKSLFQKISRSSNAAYRANPVILFQFDGNAILFEVQCIKVNTDKAAQQLPSIPSFVLRSDTATN